MTPTPQLGSVVWAEFEDANGIHKRRPAVIVSPSADIGTAAPIRLVAITTRLPTPLPNDYVLLPWDPQGKARSGLKKKCAAVAGWQTVMPLQAVSEVVGILPAATIAQILERIAAVAQPETPDSHSDSHPNGSTAD